MQRFSYLPAVFCCTIAFYTPSMFADSGGSELEEVLVTGSHIPRHDRPSTSRVTYDRAYIEQTGSNTLTDFVSKLPVNTGAEFQVDSFTQNFSQTTASVNLRGLGLGSTLVLVDGRRQTYSAAVATDGSSFVDINVLPLIMIDSVEVAKEGASANYGSDAIAGVVNFRTRNDFNGFELSTGYQSTDGHDQEDADVGMLWGGGDDLTHLVVAMNYMERTPLNASERAFARGTGLSDVGSPGSFLPIPTVLGGSPYDPAKDDFDVTVGALTAIPNTILPILPSACASGGGVPVTLPGSTTYGLCKFDFIPYYELVTAEQRLQSMATLSHEISGSWMTYGSVQYSELSADNIKHSPSFPVSDFVTISRDAPGNTYGADLLYLGRPLGSGSNPMEVGRSNNTYRAVWGVDGKLDNTWQLGAHLQHSLNEYTMSNKDIVRARFQQAINNGSWNFQLPSTSQVAGIAESFFEKAEVERRAKLTTAEFVLSGAPFKNAHGDIDFAYGAQYRREGLLQDVNELYQQRAYGFLMGGDSFNRDREVLAAFAEMRLPLLSSLTLDTAMRYEDYGSDGDESLDPKLSLTWELSPQLQLYGVFAKAFRAPSLSQLQGEDLTALEQVTDKKGKTEYRSVLPLGNEQLMPERATSSSVGMLFEPETGTTINLSYWKVIVDDVVIRENAQAIAASNPLDPRIVPVTAFPALIQYIKAQYINSGEVTTDGFDLGASQHFYLNSRGELRIGVEATKLRSYSLTDETVPGSPTIDAAGNRNFSNFARSLPEWRATVFGQWQLGAHEVGTGLHYIGSYENDQRLLNPWSISPQLLIDAGERIDDQLTIDIHYGYRWENKSGSTIRLSCGLINATDEAPPSVDTNLGYDSKVHDPRGRLLVSRIIYSF